MVLIDKTKRTTLMIDVGVSVDWKIKYNKVEDILKIRSSEFKYGDSGINQE